MGVAVGFCLLATGLAQDSPTAEEYQPEIAEASNEGREAMARFTVTDGFRLELFAAEPLLANPTCFFPTEDGAFFVAETFRLGAGVSDLRQHPDWLADELAGRTVEDRLATLTKFAGASLEEQYGREQERIRRITDTDGDGVADFASVWADGFGEIVDGLGAGLVEFRGSIYFGCVPHVWKLTDTDGDGRADERASLSSGYGVRVGLPFHGLHGMTIGPDGKLYFACGDRGFSVDAGEAGTIDHPHTGAVLRCNLDGSELEVIHTGLRNPGELAFDRYGNLFTGDAASGGGEPARLVQVVEGADSGWRSSYQWLDRPGARGPWLDEGLWQPAHEEQALYVLPPVATIGQEPAGLAHYPGTGLPPGYDGYFLLADARGEVTESGIHFFSLEALGAGFELKTPGRLVWGTVTTDVDFAPDGAIYFTDWVQGREKTGKGRIYRLYIPRLREAPATETVRAILVGGLVEVEPADLARMLGHADQRVRRKAQFELVRRGEAGWAALRDGLVNAKEELARIHCVWGLGMAARENPELLDFLNPFLKDPEPRVRAQLARVLGDHRHAPALSNLIKAVADEDPTVRSCAAIACARIGDPRAVEALFTLARGAGDQDPVLRHVATYGLSRCAGEERLLEALQDTSRHARVAAVVALRRQGSTAVARFLHDPDARVVLETARAIHDVPIAGALPALAEWIGAETLEGDALVRRVLNANLRVGGEERARALTDFALEEGREAGHRADALRLLAQWARPEPRDDVSGAWRPLEPREAENLPTLVERLGRKGILRAPAELLVRWIDLAEIYSVKSVAPTLSEIVAGRDFPPVARRRALEALGPLGNGGFEESLGVALQDTDVELRAAALDALPRIDLERALPLYRSVLANGQIEERRTLYRTLVAVVDPRIERLLRDQYDDLVAGLLPAELRLDLVEALRTASSESLKKLPAKIDQTRRAADPILGEWIDTLLGGDAQRGEQLFRTRAELSCVRCHRSGEEAADGVGPNLEGVGERLTRLDLLRSVVDHQAQLTPGYESVLLILADERQLTGRIIEEGESKLTLETPAGERVDVELSSITERRPGLSSMPDDLEAALDRFEMRDLIEYLSRR